MAEAAPNTGEAQGELALVPVSTASTGLTNEEEFGLGESERGGCSYARAHEARHSTRSVGRVNTAGRVGAALFTIYLDLEIPMGLTEGSLTDL